MHRDYRSVAKFKLCSEVCVVDGRVSTQWLIIAETPKSKTGVFTQDYFFLFIASVLSRFLTYLSAGDDRRKIGISSEARYKTTVIVLYRTM